MKLRSQEVHVGAASAAIDSLGIAAKAAPTVFYWHLTESRRKPLLQRRSTDAGDDLGRGGTGGPDCDMIRGPEGDAVHARDAAILH